MKTAILKSKYNQINNLDLGFRLITKIGSTNFRTLVTQGIMKRIKPKTIEINIYEENSKKNVFFNLKVVKFLEDLKALYHTIILNKQRHITLIFLLIVYLRSTKFLYKK